MHSECIKRNPFLFHIKYTQRCAARANIAHTPRVFFAHLGQLLPTAAKNKQNKKKTHTQKNPTNHRVIQQTELKMAKTETFVRD